MKFLSKSEIALLRRQGKTPSQILKIHQMRGDSAEPLREMADVDGHGRKNLKDTGTVVFATRFVGKGIELIELPQGLYLRVTKGNSVVQFLNIRENRKR